MEEILNIFYRALEAPVRVKTASPNEAIALRHRMNRVRKEFRKKQQLLGRECDLDGIVIKLEGSELVVKQLEFEILEGRIT